MQSISTIGLDIAKSVFQVHGIDAASGFQEEYVQPGKLPAVRSERDADISFLHSLGPARHIAAPRNLGR